MRSLVVSSKGASGKEVVCGSSARQGRVFIAEEGYCEVGVLRIIHRRSSCALEPVSHHTGASPAAELLEPERTKTALRQ